MTKIVKLAEIIDGQKLARQKEKRLVAKITEFKKKFGLVPKLVAVMVGDNQASKLYLRVKEKAAKRVGILFEKKKFPVSAKPKAIVEFIKAANGDSSVHGIIVQLPLPKEYVIPANWAGRRDTQNAILGSIEPTKDVDCLTPENLGLLVMGKLRFLPATVKAVMTIIAGVYRIVGTKRSGIVSDMTPRDNGCNSLGVGSIPPPVCGSLTPKDWEFLQGREVVVVGAGRAVGLPLAVHLKNLGATVTICDEFTKNLAEHTKKAEILISATGLAGLIKKEMVKKGAIVIDVGSPKGDVDFGEVKKIASTITPVPGGVGPLTVVSLLENVMLSAKVGL